MSTEKDDQLIALQLSTAGEKYMPDVLQLLKSSKLSDLCYAYKIRTKPDERLLDKVQRKLPEKPDYNLGSITDVVGLRLVALFRADIPDLLSGVLSAILHENGIEPNPFAPLPPEELIIYKGVNAFDELSGRIKENIKHKYPNMNVVERNSREGYSSVHVVARLSNPPKKNVPYGGYLIPIEIQIRSVFEDAWGEIDHKYGYVIRSGKDAGTPVTNPEFVLGHLKVLKRFSDACMDYADLIRNEAVGAPPALYTKRSVISVQSDELILKRFSQLGVEEGVIKKYRFARELKDRAASLLESNNSEGKAACLNGAEAFREMADGLGARLETEGALLLNYYVRMNEALCLMAVNQLDEVMAAANIYRELTDKYAEYPLLEMRYGQAQGKLGHIEDAIVHLRDAGNRASVIARRYEHQPPEAWPDILPFVDYKHIKITQPKLLGYHIWLKLRGIGNEHAAAKIALFKEAYDITRLALDSEDKEDSKSKRSIHNNLLYYSIGQLSRSNALADEEVPKLEHQTREHLRYVVDHVGPLADAPIPTLDTLMKAYSLLGESKHAKDVAKMLIHKCLNTPTMELDANERIQLIQLAVQVADGNPVMVVD